MLPVALSQLKSVVVREMGGGGPQPVEMSYSLSIIQELIQFSAQFRGFEVFATRLYLLFVFSGVIPAHYTVCILQPAPPSAGGQTRLSPRDLFII